MAPPLTEESVRTRSAAPLQTPALSRRDYPERPSGPEPDSTESLGPSRLVPVNAASSPWCSVAHSMTNPMARG